MLAPIFLAAVAVFSFVAAQKPLIGVSIPPEYSYLLPTGFSGNISADFIDMTTSNHTINALLASARNASYYAFDQEFHEILGSNPTIRQVDYAPGGVFAEEAGIWIPEKNEVWFTSDGSKPPTYFSVLNLKTFTVTAIKNDTLSDGRTPNGGTYFDGLTYFTTLGNKTINQAPGIFSVNTTSYDATPILNSYYGVHINSVNDLTWVPSSVCPEASLFFTSFDLTPFGDPDANTAVLPNAVFRVSCNSLRSSSSSGVSPVQGTAQKELILFTLLFPEHSSATTHDPLLSAPSFYFFIPPPPFPLLTHPQFTPQKHSLRAVISRNDILAPNGIAHDPSSRLLYVTDVSATRVAGPGASRSASVAIYRFTLDSDCNPTNKVMFALPRSGLADGIHVDDFGRVWTAEYNGVVVRGRDGRELGVFNAEALGDAGIPIANFALAGDKLVVGAYDRFWVVQLGMNVTGTL
jgi:gluconolactonase